MHCIDNKDIFFTIIITYVIARRVVSSRRGESFSIFDRRWIFLVIRFLDRFHFLPKARLRIYDEMFYEAKFLLVYLSPRIMRLLRVSPFAGRFESPSNIPNCFKAFMLFSFLPWITKINKKWIARDFNRNVKIQILFPWF